MTQSFGSFVAGYVVATSILAVYLITLWRRGRRADARIADLRRREHDAGVTRNG
jgi:hypothetical protein